MLAACSSSIGGSAQRRPPAPLNEVLPTTDQVAEAVGNPLDPAGSAASGSISLLPNGIRDGKDVAPLDCLGSASPLMRVVYEKGDVHQVALRDFARYGEGLTVSSVHAGVVRFSSDAEAARMFGDFATRWRVCDGTAVRVHVTATSDLQWRVGGVRNDGAVLSDTVVTGAGRNQAAFSTEHALGLVDAYIVEADVAVTDPPPGGLEANTRAVDLVREMVGNVARAG